MNNNEIPHAVRYPDYGVPYKVIAKHSWASYILSYASFVNRTRSPGVFTLEDYRGFRVGEVRTDKWRKGIKTLLSCGYIIELSDGSVQITAKGVDAAIRIGKRNAASRVGAPREDDY